MTQTTTKTCPTCSLPMLPESGTGILFCLNGHSAATTMPDLFEDEKPKKAPALRMAPPPCPTEFEEQSMLFKEAECAKDATPALEWLFAISNGGYFLTPAAAGKLKAAGLKAGVPDTFLSVPRGEFHGLFIEMKRRNASPSDTKPEQLKWHAALRSMGYRVEVCKGWVAAWSVLMDYLNSEEA